MADSDKSNGYEAVALQFIARRGQSSSGIGVALVAEWARTLPAGATVLDLGCGSGLPISQTLMDRGLKVHGVDASPAMVAAFRSRFPGVPVECAAVEDSDFFGETFDGVIAWGLFFLLDAEVQRMLIKKIANALRDGGKFLFIAPRQSCSWQDAMTGRMSISLGHEEYEKVLKAEGLILTGTQVDEGENFYYLAQKK